ncbi:MAG: tetratricopeptide repeat protein [Paludibacteraceae bacterium]
MKKSLMFILLLGLVSVSFAGNKLATDYYDADDYEMAKLYFLSGNMDAMDCYYLGQIYLKTNKKDSAQYYYNKGLQIDPANLYNSVGIATINNDAKALKAISKNKEYKKDINMQLAIAEAFAINNQTADADSYVAKAKKIDKKNPLSYIFEGKQLETKKMVNEAASKLENAIYFDPNFKLAYLKLGQVYENVRTQVAMEYLNKAISLDPNYAAALNTLGNLATRQGFYPEALEAYNKYLNVITPTSKDYETYAKILYFNKKYDQTLNAISKAPNNFVMNRLKMYCENELGNKASAMAIAANFFKTTKTTDCIPQDYTTYAKLLSDDKNFTEAAVYYEKAYQLDTTKIDILKDVAKSYESGKNYQKSAEYFKKLTTIPNASLSDVFTLGRTYYIAGNDTVNSKELRFIYLNEADSTFNVLCEKLADNYMGYFWRARTNAALDPETSKGLAKPYYEKAVELLLPQKDDYKNELMEAYRYLGYYNYLKNDVEQAKTYFNKVLEINPDDAVSQQAINGLEASSKKKK